MSEGDRTSPAKGLPRAFHVRGSNPAGQPKKIGARLRELLAGPMTDLTRRAMSEKLGLASIDDVPTFEDRMDGLLWLLAELAARADFDAIREILDRVAPKPRRMEVSGPGGGPIRSRVQAGPPTAEDIASGDAYFAALPGIDPGEEDE